MLEGRVAFVTGGRGGIGRAICDRFSKEGAHVFAGDLNAAGSLSKETDRSNFVRLDVTSEREVQAAMAASCTAEIPHGGLWGTGTDPGSSVR
jgi:NAD(P)-dependent dehydrogenase (short-subunit alcohol dehydrogenase family)